MCLCEEGGRRERGRKTKKERNEKEVNINKFIRKHTQTQTQIHTRTHAHTHTHTRTHARTHKNTHTDRYENKHLEDMCMQSRNYSCVRARMQTGPKTMTQCINDKTCVHHTVHNRRQ